MCVSPRSREHLWNASHLVTHGDLLITDPDWFPFFSRLVELAPQYYLGNLPPSEGKELLMALRRSLEPQSVPEEHSHAQRGGAEADSAPCQPPAERCLIQ